VFASRKALPQTDSSVRNLTIKPDRDHGDPFSLNNSCLKTNLIFYSLTDNSRHSRIRRFLVIAAKMWAESWLFITQSDQINHINQ